MKQFKLGSITKNLTKNPTVMPLLILVGGACTMLFMGSKPRLRNKKKNKVPTS